MNKFTFTVNPIELISGTNNTVAPAYMEASKIFDTGNKALNYVKRILKNIIQKTSGKSINKEIAASQGSIIKYSEYDNITKGLKILQTHAKDVPLVKQLATILKALKDNTNSYVEGYNKQIFLVQIEYDSAVHLLHTGVSFAIADNIDVKMDNDNIITYQKKNGTNKGILTTLIFEMAKGLSESNHSNYLKQLIKTNDEIGVSTVTEATAILSVATMAIDLVSRLFNDAVGLVGGIIKFGGYVRKTLFGILPLIRSILQLYYNRKVNKIIQLDEQIKFLELNIEQLQNIKTMDPAKRQVIIQKQQAILESFKRKTEKLKAEFIEDEKNTMDDIKQSEIEDKTNKNVDEEFTL